MIFLWGLEEDTPMRWVHEELLKAGAPVFYLDHHDVFDCEIESSFGPGGERHMLYSPTGSLDLTTVTAAYCRPYNFRDYEALKGKPYDDPLATKASCFEMHLTAYLDSSDAYVLNRSAAFATNNSKPLQLSLIRKAGLKVPETFITNNEAEAQAFLNRCPDAIFKSVSGQRSIVEKVNSDHRLQLQDVKWCPTLFQQALDGTNYRVHIVDNQIFTVCIASDKLDYRYGNSTIVPETLPADIEEKCRLITSMLGLHLSGIDLMRTADDEWYCFEVNPSPAFSYYQAHSGLPIGAAIARALIDNSNLRSAYSAINSARASKSMSSTSYSNLSFH